MLRLTDTVIIYLVILKIIYHLPYYTSIFIFPGSQPQILQKMKREVNGQLLDKRQKFRNSIRTQHIQNIKIARRKQMYNKQNIQKNNQNLNQQNIYFKIFNEPLLVYSQKQKYLQVLRDALGSDIANDSSKQHYLYNVLTCLVKFYFDTQNIERYCHLLLQCLGLLYYQGNFNGQIVDQSIQLCLIELNRSKNEGEFLRNRCLLLLQNITASENLQTLSFALKRGMLDEIDIILQELPISNIGKQHILGIFGNMIEYLLTIEDFHNQPYKYLKIVSNCIIQNQNTDILSRSIQIFQALIHCKYLPISKIIEPMQSYVFNLSLCSEYIPRTQNFVVSTLQKMEQEKQQSDKNMKQIVMQNDIIIPYLQSIMVSLTYKPYDNYDLRNAIRANKLLLLANQQAFQEQAVAFKNSELATVLFDHWSEMEDDCQSQIELQMLQFLQICFRSKFTFIDIVQQNNINVRKNSSDLPTWELIQQFLQIVNLETPPKMHSFVYIFCIQYVASRLDLDYRECFNQKIEQGFYHQDKNISEMAHRALQMQENWYQ